MLSSVLKSDTAVQTSINIIKSFVSMRKFLQNNASIFQKIESIEKRQISYEIKNDTKSIIIDKHDEVTVSKLSSYTLIGRIEKRNFKDIKGGDIIWVMNMVQVIYRF